MKIALGMLLALFTLGSTPMFSAVMHEGSIDEFTAHNIIDIGLNSKDPSVRVEAIRATGMTAKTEAVRKKIEGLLSDKNPDVRIAATESLADLSLSKSDTALEDILDNDQVPEVQFAAAKALYKLKDPMGKLALEEVLDKDVKTSSSMLQREKRHFLANFYSIHSTTAFLLDTGGGFVPVPGVGMGMSEVAQLMTDTALTPRATVVLILGRDKGKDVDKILRDSLEDKDWTVRATAALMIALTARKHMRNDLVPLFSDADERVRFRAAGAYLHLSGPSAKDETIAAPLITPSSAPASAAPKLPFAPE